MASEKKKKTTIALSILCTTKTKTKIKTNKVIPVILFILLDGILILWCSALIPYTEAANPGIITINWWHTQGII